MLFPIARPPPLQVLVPEGLAIIRCLLDFYLCLVYFLFRNGSLAGCPFFKDSRAAQVHVFSLATTLRLWDEPHYRDVSFGTDIRKNLRNLAVPGTGLALSYVTCTRLVGAAFILVGYPLLALLAALYQAAQGQGRAARFFREYLLDPGNWFAIWRLNCLLVAYHSWLAGGLGDSSSQNAAQDSAMGKQAPSCGNGSGRQASSRGSGGAEPPVLPTTVLEQYEMEDKGVFLLTGAAAGVPVSPFLTADQLPELVAKHKSIEGGMGIHFLTNFAAGGDWILQPRLRNSDFLARLLPPGAPLSTLRVITASRAWLMQQQQHDSGFGSGAQGGGSSGSSGYASTSRGGGANGGASHGHGADVVGANAANGASASDGSREGSGHGGGSNSGHGGAGDGHSGQGGGAGSCSEPTVEVMTVVLRAGRAGATTDHECVAFSVDARMGLILPGTSNMHWYRLGVRQYAGRLPPAGPPRRFSHHPDMPEPLAGNTIPDFQRVLSVCTSSHETLLPQVPLVGWDVALTPEGPLLLELNISCNFFMGQYDRERYISFMYDMLVALQQAERQRGSGSDGSSNSNRAKAD